MPADTAMTASAASSAVRSAPGRERVAAAELLGLPRPQRLQAVRGHHVRHAVQQLGDVPGEVGVPGVGVHQVGARARRRPSPGRRRACAAPALAPASAGRVRRSAVTPGSSARRAEAVHPDVGQPAQLAGEVLDVHPRAAVDLGRVLPGEQVDAHGTARCRADVERPVTLSPTAAHELASSAARMLASDHGAKVLAIVLAGGEGKRLMPLTADRAKPAVPVRRASTA